MLRLSVLDQSIATAGRPHGHAIRDTVDLARYCEGLGYHRFWVSEHHSHPTIVGTAPEILVAALAVQVKSHMGWQAGYEVGPKRGLRFDGPGCTTLNFARLPFTGPRRELFPLKDSPPNPVKLWQSI